MQNLERLIKIVLAPCLSEKSVSSQAYCKYVFKVSKWATKPEIAAAVHHLFDVDVEFVCISNVSGKRKKFGGRQGKCKDWKKAYVTLKSGQTINVGGT